MTLEIKTAAELIPTRSPPISAGPPTRRRPSCGPLTERDAADAIIGVLPGLSLGDHPHRFWVNGRRMST